MLVFRSVQYLLWDAMQLDVLRSLVNRQHTTHSVLAIYILFESAIAQVRDSSVLVMYYLVASRFWSFYFSACRYLHDHAWPSKSLRTA